jgi:hypothetical protein
MNTKTIQVLLLSMILVGGLTSCKNETTNETKIEDVNQISEKKIIKGYVKVIERGNYLVISDSNIDIDDINNLSTQELIDKYKEEYIISTKVKEQQDIMVSGVNVKIWYDYIRESNPPRTKILKLEIVN